MPTPLIVLLLALAVFLSLRIIPWFYYAVGTTLYHLAIRIASPVYRKASLMVRGRKNILSDINKHFNFPGSKKIWFHCASLGEFEQGRPLIEQIRNEFPDCKILLTFYSPSGYEMRKNYPVADHVCYLPFDTKSNARAFISAVKPDIAIFVKYEFWLYHIAEIKKQQIPLFLVSALFSKKQIFFKWHGHLFRRSLKNFTQLFVQDKNSVELLGKYKINNAVVGYDTRFDRVYTHMQQRQEIPPIKDFATGFNVLVAGSTWPKDEKVISSVFYQSLVYLNFKLIVAPHLVDEKHLGKTLKAFKKYSVRFSEIGRITNEEFLNKRVLILDNMGMLSSVYHYGDICYIGGGFTKGIHNTLEAAVYGKPILFGPRHEKFKEATDLVKAGAAFIVRNDDALLQILNYMNDFGLVYKSACEEAANYVKTHTGGTEVVMQTLRKYF